MSNRKFCLSVLIQGGLGNQMFQYAASKWLSYKIGHEVHLDLSLMRAYRTHDYALDKYIESAPLLDFRINNKILRILYLKIYLTIMRLFGRLIAYDNPSSGPELLLQSLESRRSFVIAGYFQNLAFLSEIKDDLKSLFIPQCEISIADWELINTIRNDPHAVCIHIRRGDYASNMRSHNKHGICPPSYYYSALKSLRRLLDLGSEKQMNLYIFSDEIDSTKDSFVEFSNVVYVSNYERHVVVEHYIMRSFANYIVANSTYSWWAAFLSERPINVMYPVAWFGDKSESPCIFPDAWHGIDCNAQ